ncbi:hypothetical protein FXW78_22640 [Rhodococcus opacus]|nr:hypothetical protein [Rhodococcus opacus]
MAVRVRAARSGELIILQNLLLGINAHINLDLPVVTGTTFGGPRCPGSTPTTTGRTRSWPR